MNMRFSVKQTRAFRRSKTEAEARHVTRVRRAVRRGAIVVEMAMAGVVLMIGMMLTVKVVGFVASQRREAEHRQRAILEVGNLMERMTAYAYDEVSAELARRLTLSDAARLSLPGSELAIDVTPSEASPGRPSKRIAIRLRWRNRSGEWDRPVRLTSWIERGRHGS
jgi:hypothetical protein